MKIFFLLILPLALVVWLVRPQEQTELAPDIEIREFSSSFRKGYVESTYNRNTNRTDVQTRERVFRDQVRNRNSIENRSRDMREMEERAARESIYSKPVDVYRYRVVVKNQATKTIKSIFWDFQASDSPTFENPSHRQFRCVIKLKPGGTERLEGYSTLPPIAVVSASGAGKIAEKLVINRIEYSDGSSWQRSSWYLPDQALQYDGRGKCQPL